MNHYQIFILLAIAAGVSWAGVVRYWESLNIVRQDKLKRLGDVALGYTISGCIGGAVLFMVWIAIKTS